MEGTSRYKVRRKSVPGRENKRVKAQRRDLPGPTGNPAGLTGAHAKPCRKVKVSGAQQTRGKECETGLKTEAEAALAGLYPSAQWNSRSVLGEEDDSLGRLSKRDQRERASMSPKRQGEQCECGWEVKQDGNLDMMT